MAGTISSILSTISPLLTNLDRKSQKNQTKTADYKRRIDAFESSETPASSFSYQNHHHHSENKVIEEARRRMAAKNEKFDAKFYGQKKAKVQLWK
jgi:hypothetical protein